MTIKLSGIQKHMSQIKLRHFQASPGMTWMKMEAGIKLQPTAFAPALKRRKGMKSMSIPVLTVPTPGPPAEDVTPPPSSFSERQREGKKTWKKGDQGRGLDGAADYVYREPRG